jgi:hypothetical protein
MQEPVGEVAVIREQQETLGIVVEASDGKEPGRVVGQQINDDGSPARVLEARDVAARLVEEQIRDGVARADGAAVEGDAIRRGIGLRSGLEAHHAVDGDTAGGEEGLSPPS